MPNLRPARDARLHDAPYRVIGNLRHETEPKPRHVGARADERDVACEHAPDLRELVYAGRPQERAHARHFIVRLTYPDAVLVAALHTPKLRHLYGLPTFADALLSDEDGALVLQADGERHKGHEDEGDEAEGKRESDVKDPPEEVIGAMLPRRDVFKKPVVPQKRKRNAVKHFLVELAHVHKSHAREEEVV